MREKANETEEIKKCLSCKRRECNNCIAKEEQYLKRQELKNRKRVTA